MLLRFYNRFQRFVLLAARVYLLVMALYLVARFTLQDRFWPLSLVNSFAIVLFVPLPILFVLALLARSRVALLNVLPVLLLVLLWFGPRFVPKPPAPPGTIRIMTNNIWRLNRTPEQVAQLALASAPDVIFFQEVLQAEQGEALARLDADYPYQTSTVDESRIAQYTAVNITLSRYPFVESNPVPDVPFMYRNVIEVDGKRIALYNIHLLAPVQAPRVSASDNYFLQTVFGFDDRRRNRQINTLLTHLATEPYPYIVAGDFNTSDLSMTYNRLAAQMHDSFIEAGTGMGGSWPLSRVRGLPVLLPPVIRIDYIWHSDGLRAVNAWQGEGVGSDHVPVLADIVFEG